MYMHIQDQQLNFLRSFEPFNHQTRIRKLGEIDKLRSEIYQAANTAEMQIKALKLASEFDYVLALL